MLSLDESNTGVVLTQTVTSNRRVVGGPDSSRHTGPESNCHIQAASLPLRVHILRGPAFRSSRRTMISGGFRGGSCAAQRNSVRLPRASPRGTSGSSTAPIAGGGTSSCPAQTWLLPWTIPAGFRWRDWCDGRCEGHSPARSSATETPNRWAGSSPRIPSSDGTSSRFAASDGQ